VSSEQAEGRLVETGASTRVWTVSQEQAIETRCKDILVSAAAGSGKTSVLVERIARRLLDPVQPVDIDRLLVVTFTESAAQEMRERIRIKLESAAQSGDGRAAAQLAILGKAAISTLHSFCLDLLRRHYYLLGVDPRFRVLDEEEASLLKLEAMEELFEEVHAGRRERFRPLIEHYSGRRDDTELRELVLSLFEYARSLPDGDRWLERAVQAYDPSHPDGQAAFSAWKEALLQEARVDVERALFSLEHAQGIARLGGGPEGYARSFEAAQAALRQALETLSLGDWDRAALALRSIPFPRLSAEKEADPVLKEEAKKAWDEAKEIVGRLGKKIFARSEASYREDLPRLYPVVRGLLELVREFEKRYDQRKARVGGVDFADLERLALAALAHPTGRALSECRRRFVEVLVDEYQDINPVQDRILTLVSRVEEGEGNRFLVGDVKQSIYRFRLADPRIFQEKHRSFAACRDGRSTRIDLQANFRSCREILEGVNFIFRQIMYEATAEIDYDESAMLRPGKDTRPVPFDPGRIELHLIERLKDERSAPEQDGTGDGDDLPDDGDLESLSAVEREAALVARLIRRLVCEGLAGRSEPVRFRDIAVLMRSPKGRATRFVEVLEAMGIPAHSSGGSGFFQAVEVQVVMALLRLIDNPQQDIPMAAALYSPILGLDEQDMARIRAAYPQLPFHAAVREFAKGEGELNARVAQFLARLDRWRSEARRIPLSRLIGKVYDETGYLDYVAALPRGRQREANLLALWQRARHFDAFATSGLDRFIRHVDDLGEAGEDVAPPSALGEGEDVVRVMSVHQSKGLEFPVVFLVDLDRRFNKSDGRRHLIFHRDLGIGARVVDRDAKVSYPSLAHRAVTGKLDRETVAEEMRLLYVALTRAKEKLVLVASATDLEQRAARAAESARMTGWRLPQGRVLRARSWLDWILSTVARHGDGRPLRALGAGDLGPEFYAPQDLEVAGAAARFSVRLWKGEEVDRMAAEGERMGGELPGISWKALARHEPLRGAAVGIDPDVARRLEAVHAWRYPYEAAARLPAKVSVTELARRFETGEEEEQAALLEPPRALLELPARDASSPGSPVERGLAVHAFLARVDLRDVSPAGLAVQVEELARRGILSSKEVGLIDLGALARFFESPLGRRIREAGCEPFDPPRLWRELAFTMRLSAEAFAKHGIADETAGGDIVVLQGVIDCLIREKDRFVVVDYKTDSVRFGEEELAARRYAWQVRLYGEFVKRSVPGALVEAYLAFLQTGTAVRVD